MKRSRTKVVGLGLALLAGPLHAAEGEAPPAAPAITAPAPLPILPRQGEWAPSGGGDGGAVWLPARKPLAVPAVQQPDGNVKPAGGIPDLPLIGGDAEGIGPRVGAGMSSVGPLPAIPTIPEPGSQQAIPDLPTVPTVPAPSPTRSPRGNRPANRVEPKGWTPIPSPTTTPVTSPAPAPTPARPVAPTLPAVPPLPDASDVPFRPLAPPAPADVPTPAPWHRLGDASVLTETPAEQPTTPLPRPRPGGGGSAGLPPAPLNAPTPVPGIPGAAPAGAPFWGTINPAEVPTAPPELMKPIGTPVPGKHGTFGSPPIRISKDYPGLAELVHDGHPGWGDPGSPAMDRVFFQAEYLLWWVRSAQIPALATTSAAPNPDLTSPLGKGFLGDPSTRTLLGPGSFGGTQRNGMRIRGGFWFDDCGTCGIDASYFFLGRLSNAAQFANLPVINRPFFAPNLNPATGLPFGEFGETVALPNFATGVLAVNNTSYLWGADVNLRKALCKTCDTRAEVFAGYRFLSLSESLQVNEFITALPGNPNDPAGTRVVVQDRFQTSNQFHGGQLGFAAERRWNRFSVDTRGSIGLGVTHEVLDISGGQLRLRPGMATPDAFNGGLLATGPNLGRFTRNKFAVVPEAIVNLGYWVTPRLKAYVGYDFLYWSNVLRPGDQIDRVVDVTQIPNPPQMFAPSGQIRPQPQFHQSDLWVQGIQFGLMGRW